MRGYKGNLRKKEFRDYYLMDCIQLFMETRVSQIFKEHNVQGCEGHCC